MMSIYSNMSEWPAELVTCTGFEWDAGNIDKNWERHQVSAVECEEVFFQRPVLIATDSKHSRGEPRFAALGRTASGRLPTIVFTIREARVRVISARPMSRRERRAYGQA